MTADDARRLVRGMRVRIKDGGGAPWCIERVYEVRAVCNKSISRHRWFVSFNGHAAAIGHEATICIGSHQSGIFDISLEPS